MIFWEQKKTAHMKRAPRNRHDTSSRPTGWILHVMFRLWKHLISSSYLPWEECTALFAWKPRRRRRRKSSSSLCSLPPPSWGLQFLHGLHRSVFITFGLIRTDTCVYTRQLPGWLAQVKENWPRPKCKKWRHLPPSLQFHFFFTKFINTDITILLATLMNFLFQRGAISEWFKRPTTVSVSSDCSRRLIYGRCSIQ